MVDDICELESVAEKLMQVCGSVMVFFLVVLYFYCVFGVFFKFIVLVFDWIKWSTIFLYKNRCVIDQKPGQPLSEQINNLEIT